MKKDFFKKIPSAISILRIILAFVFLFFFLNDKLVLSVIIFIFAIFSDALDGYLARKFDIDTSFGAYLDITADFFLVLIAFSSFILKGIYPVWILFLIILVFLQFIITSKFKILVYDPIGKYYGSFLFIIILITLISPNTVYGFLLDIIIIFTLISLISRCLFFIFKNRN